MNKEKLIALIIKKETYKDTKPIQADILRKKEQAVSVSIGAINQVLKDEYNVEAKLYAVRYLKDCFEKGNQSFIARTEQKILPVLVKMVKDSESETSIMKYGGSYTKTEDLQKFKSLVTSLFTMSRECIEKWAIWIPDPNRGFAKAQKQIDKVKRDWEGFSYFREENQVIFRQNCQKNGVKLLALAQKMDKVQKQNRVQQSRPSQQPKTQTPQQNIKKMAQPPLPQPMGQQKLKYKSMTKVFTILKQTEQKVKSRQFFTEKQLNETEAKFNAAVNQYIEEASQFDEHFLQAKIQEFQALKEANKGKNVARHSKITDKQESKLGSNSNINSNSQLQEKVIVKAKDVDAGSDRRSQKLQPPQIKITPVPPPLPIPKVQPITQPQAPMRTTITTSNMGMAKKEGEPQSFSKILNSEENKAPKKSQLSIMEEEERVNFQQSEEESEGELSREGRKQLISKNNSNLDARKDEGKGKEAPGIGSNKTTAKFLLEEEFTPAKTNEGANNISDPATKNMKMPQSNRASQVQRTVGPQTLTPKTTAPMQMPPYPSPKNPTSMPPSQFPVPPVAPRSPSQAQIDQLTKKYEYETVQLYGKIQRLQREMLEMREREAKMRQGPTGGDAREVELLRNKLEKEQQDKYGMGEEIKGLRAELRKMKLDFEKSKEEWRNFNSRSISEITPNHHGNQTQRNSTLNVNAKPNQNLNNSKLSAYKARRIQPNNSHLTSNDPQQELSVNKSQSRVKSSVLPVEPQESPVVVNKFSPRLDEDYVNGMTSFDKLGSWLDQKNLLGFKMCVLGLSEEFYADEGLRVYRLQHLFAENGAEFLKLTFSFHFKRVQQRPPKVMYKNIAQVDFWTKPCTGANQIYTQQTIARLCMIPIKIMKVTIWYDQNQRMSSTFLLPFLFYNYLQPQEFSPEQFEEVMQSRPQQVQKSKVFPLSNLISPTAIDMPNILRGSVLSNQFLEICLKEQAEDRVFMLQVQLLRNQKAVVRVLPIPYESGMVAKAKELIGNFVFLLSA